MRVFTWMTTRAACLSTVLRAGKTTFVRVPVRQHRSCSRPQFAPLPLTMIGKVRMISFRSVHSDQFMT
jgi:hypothetical protein